MIRNSLNIYLDLASSGIVDNEGSRVLMILGFGRMTTSEWCHVVHLQSCVFTPFGSLIVLSSFYSIPLPQSFSSLSFFPPNCIFFP